MENQKELDRLLRMKCLELASTCKDEGGDVVTMAESFVDFITAADKFLKESSKPESEKRRSGRTTRIVDQAIQDLFNEKIVCVYGHNENIDTLMNMVSKRMKSEHPYVEYSRINNNILFLIK